MGGGLEGGEGRRGGRGAEVDLARERWARRDVTSRSGSEEDLIVRSFILHLVVSAK